MGGVLRALGVRVRRVDDLDERALFLPKSKLLLLDYMLSEAEATDAADRAVLAACLQESDTHLE